MRAGVLLREGRHREAIEVQERALELHSRISGPESLDAAMGMATMGNALSTIGDYKGAIEYYEQSLALKESLVGPASSDARFHPRQPRPGLRRPRRVREGRRAVAPRPGHL